MTANLTITKNGEAEMFYTGQLPWHGLGQYLESPATSEEAIIAAHLNWNVIKLPVYFKKDGSDVIVDDGFATIREDNSKVLGVVGNEYTIVQNNEAFSFFDNVVGMNAAMYHTAGSLGDGKKVWILAKLPDNIVIKANDIIDKYILLYTSHDGSTGLHMMATPVRVVCQNTLNVAIAEGSREISIRHTKNYGGRLEEAKRILGLTLEYYANFETIANAMAEKQLNTEKLSDYITTLIPLVAERGGVKTNNTQRIKARNRITTLFDNPKNTLPGIRGSLWSAYNAATEYADWGKRAKGLEGRLNSVWFGPAANFKQRALDTAMAILNG
jgi:phage/plasmid-like protein (TIGR03299 family)